MNEFYQHRYGGVYVVDDIATHTGSKEHLVIYTHVYPFEEQAWARPAEEWTEDRFKRITYSEVKKLMEKDREAFQIEITTAKAHSKR